MGDGERERDALMRSQRIHGRDDFTGAMNCAPTADVAVGARFIAPVKSSRP